MHRPATSCASPPQCASSLPAPGTGQARRGGCRPNADRCPLPRRTPALRAGSKVTPSIQALGPHVAPLGMRFYSWRAARSAFPRAYDGSLLVAEHGSGGLNATDRLGYRCAQVQVGGGTQGVGAHVVVVAVGVAAWLPWHLP